MANNNNPVAEMIPPPDIKSLAEKCISISNKSWDGHTQGR